MVAGSEMGVSVMRFGWVVYFFVGGRYNWIQIKKSSKKENKEMRNEKWFKVNMVRSKD
jgi:hypothetical protein